MNSDATTSKHGQKQRKLAAKERFYITDFINPSGQVAYCVTGYKPGKGRAGRVRENYKTEDEARARKIELDLEVASIIDATVPKPTPLTMEQLKDAELALARLRSSKLPYKTLTEVAEWICLNYQEPVRQKTVEAAFDEFIAARKKQNRREGTIRNLEGRIGMFSRLHGAKNVSDITKRDCHEFVYREGSSPRNQINDRLAVGNFLNWCVRQEFAVINHMEAVDRPTVDESEPQILSLGDCRKLLAAARDYKDGALLPYVVVSLFAGLRPSEAQRLTWDRVNLNNRTITVIGGAAKKRKRRIVKLPDAAIDWLLPLAPSHPKFGPDNFRGLLDRVKYAAGFRPEDAKGEDKKLPPWVQDYLRHTAISMYLAKTDNENETAAWAGNSPDVIHSHYKGLVTDATDFWALTPASVKSEIVQFPWVKAA